MAKQIWPRDFKKEIQDLIDDFPDDDFEELLEEMIDVAHTALDARREEKADEDDK
jgi:ubiquitin C-terminal hydrolase